jgi:hypothetical protein
MKPSIGRIVHVFANPAQNNGADVAPAVITRVWNDQGVNVRVLLDGPDTPWLTSITLHETREEAQKAHDEMVAAWPEDQRGSFAPLPFRAFWPERV